MKKELQELLFNNYPVLFENRLKGCKESCLSFGVECGDGWYDIISSLCWMIAQHETNISNNKLYLEKNNPEKLKNTPEYFPVKFDQVKEKFGGLRVYFSGGDDYINGLVRMAESFSYKICEVCGEKGSPNKSGWISTLCEICKKNK
jgi:hypothetical protein